MNIREKKSSFYGCEQNKLAFQIRAGEDAKLAGTIFL